jgi:hypothetical protein
MTKSTKPTTPSKRGGARPGAGAPLKDPRSGARVPITIKVAPATVATLRASAGAEHGSQGEIIDRAVAEWADHLRA